MLIHVSDRVLGVFYWHNWFEIREYVYTHCLWGVISYACLNFDGGLAEPPLELGREWDICGMEIPVHAQTSSCTAGF